MILVSDTSVLVDLERGSLLQSCFRAPFEFVVPDLLHEREIRPVHGDDLRRRGLRVAALDGDGVAMAIGYQRTASALSLSDSFALALAKVNDWTLLTGDAALRKAAERERVDCHGVLWLLDRLFAEAVVSRQELHAGLHAISSHPRCRLPKSEIRSRLERWGA